MARCQSCGAEIPSYALPCPYCEGGLRRAPRQFTHRFCDHCGEYVTTMPDAVWCRVCGFPLRPEETPPPGPAPAAPTRPRSAGYSLFALFLLVLGAVMVAQTVPGIVGAFTSSGADPSIHAATVIPLVAPGHSDHETGADSRELAYTVRGHEGIVPVTLYRGVFDALPDDIIGYVGDDQVARYRRIVGESTGSPYIRDFAVTIESMSDNPDDQARIAVSLVQNLEYDDERAAAALHGVWYPYETLYLERGVCSDRAVLLAALLHELGFGVALLRFDAESHMAVGLRCPAGYEFRGTGYAFVESAGTKIMTDAEGRYGGGVTLTSTPEVIPVAEGRAFASIGTEAKDAAEWNALLGMGRTLDAYHYGRWQELSKKYGLVPTED